jgi:hypothetical protein
MSRGVFFMTPQLKSRFIGKTGIIAQVLQTKIPLIKRGQIADPLERRLCFTGPPEVPTHYSYWP